MLEWTNEQKLNQDGILTQSERKEGTWILANSSRHQRLRKPDTRHCAPIPRSVNRYEVLQNLKEPKTGPRNLGTANNRKCEVRTKGVSGERKQKVIIIGDSHAKGCAAEITHNLGTTFEITGYVKPGTGLEEITNIASKEIDKLTKKDMVVVWGGANNIAKNESEKGLVHISNFVKQRKHTNIIIVGAPKRHDLSPTSCVTSEVTTYNKKLHKRMKMFEYAKVLDSEAQREHFTRHGLHMNTMGKELMAQRITDQIRKTLSVRKTPPIVLKWRQDFTDSGQEGTEAQEKVTHSRTSGRKRKQPASSGDDFLWTADLMTRV